MDNLRFVLESPHLNQAQKKRPRLVTSCDNCRLKKIKCTQLKTDNGKCEACDSANIDCQFRDRERYFAERSRIVTGATAGPSSAHSRRSSTPSVGQGESSSYPHNNYDGSSPDGHGWYPGSAQPSGLDPVHQSRYSSHSPAPYAHTTPDTWFAPEADVQRSAYDRRGMPRQHYVSSPLSYPSSSTSDYPSYSSSALPTGLPQDAPTSYTSRASSSSTGLFDPRQPNLPHPTLMAPLLSTFFEQFGRNFPFLQYDDISRRVYNGTLSPLLANSIAALSARHSSCAEILTRGAPSRLLGAASQPSYVEILHAVIIIFWTDYKAGRTTGCIEFSQMATKMAFNLGLSSNDVSVSTVSASSERERVMLRETGGVGSPDPADSEHPSPRIEPQSHTYHIAI
ncbi:hypothetical protein EW146_g2766 [Bondarzewia mesenterica]|uniref:Zn(2)-C6 fungal-type domain-containing protein n=1 Tax=Bondarzewia mesenterica TaxID=1095465 RepID=A0A4S4M171_9AGAM|nr:hypothetical protein EW146_g2766 [Bondarzewia mesenterica]